MLIVYSSNSKLRPPPRRLSSQNLVGRLGGVSRSLSVVGQQRRIYTVSGGWAQRRGSSTVSSGSRTREGFSEDSGTVSPGAGVVSTGSGPLGMVQEMAREHSQDSSVFASSQRRTPCAPVWAFNTACCVNKCLDQFSNQSAFRDRHPRAHVQDGDFKLSTNSCFGGTRHIP
ncbi:hypothetical protein NPIL_508631 [Nephila pilipes]|uniref:Uncharacterized protein n=1 Tax=Nephila pilipes TaxID=299642 RepID=A0A8X6K2B9_NEPPI|nr:hypothetical protein NPIL_508631 [Nephila pilipes]